MADIQFTRPTRSVRFASAPAGGRSVRAAVGKPKSFNATERTFEFVLTSEKPCRTWRWDSKTWDIVEIDEVLLMSGMVEIDEFIGAGIFEDHFTWGAPIGVIESARIEGSLLICTGRLSSRKNVEDIALDMADGIRRNFSIGYEILEEDPPLYDNRTVPLVNVTKWRAKEASLVGVPADDTAKIRSAKGRGTRTHARNAPMDFDKFSAGLADHIRSYIEKSGAVTDVEGETQPPIVADEDIDDVEAEENRAGETDPTIEELAEAAGKKAADAVRAAAAKKPAAKPAAKPAKAAAKAASRSAADQKVVDSIRAACAKRGFTDEFEIVETTGGSIDEMRAVMLSSLKTNPQEVDASARSAAEPKTHRDVKFERTTAGQRLKNGK